MKRLSNKYNRVKLKLFDFKLDSKQNYSFTKSVVKVSLKGFFSSMLWLFLLWLTDHAAIIAYQFLDTFPNSSIPCGLYNRILIGITNIDRLADVITISAGVLGVLLGLFYTAFMTIVATKYSNINSTISLRLLEQKTLNRYFALLSTLTSLSILCQFGLALGYEPTIVSCFLYSLFVIVALTSFIRYGKFSLIYFDTSFLVQDLINENNEIISKIINHKEQLANLGRGRTSLLKIYGNIKSIQLIIKESKNPQTNNTSLDSISKDLFDFSIYFNSIKHTIPSKSGWHIQKYQYRSWENAKMNEFSLLQKAGVDLPPDSIDSYNIIEKQIISAQFEIFDQYVDETNNIQLLMNQFEYLQVNAIQCDFELLEYFFEKLEQFINDKIEKYPSNLLFRLQLVSLYPKLLIAHLVGFNNNLKLFSINNLKKLAHSIHHDKSTDEIMQFPYFIRLWLDNYKTKLSNDLMLNKKIRTPIFFTEFELCQNIQNSLLEHWKKLVPFIEKRIETLSSTFSADQNLEVMQLNIDCIELSKKLILFETNTGNTLQVLNELNFQKETAPFQLKNHSLLEAQLKQFTESTYERIWNSKVFASQLQEKNLPDIYGNYYHVLLDDIVNTILADNFDEQKILKNGRLYFVTCLDYIGYLNSKYSNSDDNINAFSKLYPIITDLFDVSSLLIIISKINETDKLTNLIIDFWDSHAKIVKNEVEYWKALHNIYEYFNQPMFSLSTPSYIKEHDRKRKFSDFLLKNNFIRKEHITRGMMKSYGEHYVSDINEVYINALANTMHMDSINFIELSQIFIEFFLKTRVALKEIKIKETRYGEQLKRAMGT